MVTFKIKFNFKKQSFDASIHQVQISKVETHFFITPLDDFLDKIFNTQLVHYYNDNRELAYEYGHNGDIDSREYMRALVTSLRQYVYNLKRS